MEYAIVAIVAFVAGGVCDHLFYTKVVSKIAEATDAAESAAERAHKAAQDLLDQLKQ